MSFPKGDFMKYKRAVSTNRLVGYTVEDLCDMILLHLNLKLVETQTYEHGECVKFTYEVMNNDQQFIAEED